ncbi:MAG: hypothetical protein R3E32_11270 [Chitinophagales bacterium]
MKQLKKIFEKMENLNMENRILYAYAMHLSRVDELPSALVEHFWNNNKSRQQIIELYQLYDTAMIAAHPHPFFSSDSKERYTTPIDWENLDEVLEVILRTALSEQTKPNRAMERKMAVSFKTTSSALHVTAPKKDAVCIGVIHFVFQQAIPQDAALHFKNNQGETSGRYEVAKGSTQFRISIVATNLFPSGLYYWTLLVGNIQMTNNLYICTEEDAKRLLEKA